MIRNPELMRCRNSNCPQRIPSTTSTSGQHLYQTKTLTKASRSLALRVMEPLEEVNTKKVVYWWPLHLSQSFIGSSLKLEA